MYYKMKKLLLGIKKLTDNSDREFGYTYGENTFLSENGKSFDFSFCEDEIGALMQKLIDDRYISQTKPHWFKLEYRALHRWLDFWDKARKFIFRSIITPIIVAFITALITSSITTHRQLKLQQSVSSQVLP